MRIERKTRGASRGRSRARDTKYWRSGRVARAPRTTYFLFPLPRVGVRVQGGDSRRRGMGLSPRILLRRDRRRRARKSLPVDLVRRGAAVSSTSRMERGDDEDTQERAHKERKKKRKKRAKIKKKRESGADDCIF